MPIPMIIYHRPNGRQQEAEMKNITDEDSAWYTEHNIKVGMEEISPEILVIYAEYGITNEEPDEITYIVPKDERCVLSMAKIRAMIEHEWELRKTSK